jgi:hypothetical protein
MPRGDRTGPWGMGSMTGRGAGFCAGYNMPGFANAAPGGFIYGRGGGRGRRNRFFATGRPGWMRGGPGPGPFRADAPAFSAEEELRNLKQEADYLERALSGVRDRIGSMEKER